MHPTFYAIHCVIFILFTKCLLNRDYHPVASHGIAKKRHLVLAVIYLQLAQVEQEMGAGVTSPLLSSEALTELSCLAILPPINNAGPD